MYKYYIDFKSKGIEIVLFWEIFTEIIKDNLVYNKTEFKKFFEILSEVLGSVLRN